jgi:hypothetical protein
MDWLSKLFIQESVSIILPIVIIIIAIFFYAARRAHLEHLERIRKIDESYHVETTSINPPDRR